MGPEERDRLRAVFDRLVPADDWPAVSEAGLFEHLVEPDGDPTGDDVRAAVSVLDAEAVRVHGTAIAELEPAAVDALIAAAPDDDREVLVRTAARAYYAHPAGAGAAMLGHRRLAQPPPDAEPPLRTTPLAALADRYDVVVLGAGAGGGVVACVLAEAGASGLLVDRGAVDPPTPDELRNPRTQADGAGSPPVVGGGTRLYQGVAWRFLPDDFAMASRYGVPDGSSLADWPITAADLAPHHEWVERTVGVCGDPGGHPAPGQASEYPMPALPTDLEAEVLRAGADRLGLRTGRVPLLLNSVPRDGRAACGGEPCGACVGFPCPTGGRNGTHNTVIPRALAAGATLVPGAAAAEITTDAGRVVGVRLVDVATGAGRSVGAGHVVVACGALESARLLLASRSHGHPDGLGNGTDQVGRHLQGHAFVSAFGSFDADLSGPGPGATIATLDLAHGNVDESGGALVGGGVLGNELRKLPIVHWQWALPPDAPRWGAAGKAAMRDTFRHTGHLFAQVQEVPRADNRVTLDPRSGSGAAAVRLSGASHPETVRTARHLVRRAEEWLAASGASRTWTDAVPTGLLAGTHQAGTCRMGTDPAASVTDPDGRVHGHDNLWVADASVHVTNGSVGPALTIMALAHRLGRTLART